VYYNWLTQSHVDTFSDTGPSASRSAAAAAASESSLLFTVGRGSSRPSRHVTRQPPVGSDFGKDKLGHKDRADGPGKWLE